MIKMLISIAVLVIILLLVVSVLFLEMVLKGRKDRRERMETPLLCENKPIPGNELREQFIANRTKLRAEGALFDETMTPVQIVNRKGLNLYGRYRLVDESCHNWVISIHGYKDDHRFMLPYVQKFYNSGYNVFTQDNRAHGLSDGRYISMGWHDKDDVYEWLDYICAMDPQAKIIVHGISMGGATTMMLSGLNHPAVIGYIEDCGYTSTWDIFETVINRDYHLPAFPIVNCCSLMSNVIMGYDYKKSSSIEQMKKCNKPILFIHGEKDDFVPCHMVHKCFDSYQGSKELFIMPDAGHAESMDYDPDRYFGVVFAFIDKYLKA